VPAQRSGDPHGPAADVRDLTAVLYALLTGRWPVGATPQPSCGVPAAPTTSDGRRRGRLTSPRQVRAGVPRSLDDLVHRVLEPSAAPGGPQTAAGLADALDAALPVERPARPARRRPGRRSTSALVGRLVVVLLAGGGWTLGGRDVLTAVGLGDLFSDDAPAAGPPPAPAPSPAVPVVLPVGAVTDFDPPPGAAPRAPTRCRTPSTVTRRPCGGPSATGAPPSAVSSRGSACWSTWAPRPRCPPSS
jgi:hypothetical protein